MQHYLSHEDCKIKIIEIYGLPKYLLIILYQYLHGP